MLFDRSLIYTRKRSMKLSQCIVRLGVSSRRYCSLILTHSYVAGRKLIMSKLLKHRNVDAHKHPKKPINRRTTVEEEEEEEEERVSKPGSISSPEMPSLQEDDAASLCDVHENAADFTDCEVEEEQASVQGSRYHGTVIEYSSYDIAVLYIVQLVFTQHHKFLSCHYFISQKLQSLKRHAIAARSLLTMELQLKKTKNQILSKLTTHQNA